MEYLQYKKEKEQYLEFENEVLNLIINGIPSIQKDYLENSLDKECFKPYYKWNTFNTKNIPIYGLHLLS